MAELRRRKAEVERALEAYRHLLWRGEPLRGAAERYELARRAEAAGRRPEARVLYTWALAADPDHALGPRSPGATRSGGRRATARTDRDTTSHGRMLAVDGAPGPRRQRGRGPSAALAFTDDAETAGLRFVYDNAETPIHQLPEPFGGGLALLDYDGDGWLDVYCVQGGPFTPASQLEAPSPDSGDRLFHNRGDGHFEDVTDASGIGRFPRGHGHGVAVGDVDGDGHPDLFVTRWRSYALYRNKGDGTFEDVTDPRRPGRRPGLAHVGGAGRPGRRRRPRPLRLPLRGLGPRQSPALSRQCQRMPISTAIHSMPRPCPTTCSAMTRAVSSM